MTRRWRPRMLGVALGCAPRRRMSRGDTGLFRRLRRHQRLPAGFGTLHQDELPRDPGSAS